MKALFDDVSYRISKNVTNTYSTSFSKGIDLLDKSIQLKIYAIYGFVRLADEIVDSFEGYPQTELLERLIANYKHALALKISTNPILNSFQEVVHDYNLQDLVDTFLESMQMDLSQQNYTNHTQYEKYIHGSAEVVGLMCLKIFAENDSQLYNELKPYAIRLGSAFQKVNFLRDIQDDMLRLGRAYFPNVDFNSFTEKDKQEILAEIKHDFEQAKIGIEKLPNNCKLGVYVAYSYYLKLLAKLALKSPKEILSKRTRVSDFSKICILYKSKSQYKLGLI